MLLAEAGMVRVDERMHAIMHGSHAQIREAYRCTRPCKRVVTCRATVHKIRAVRDRREREAEREGRGGE